MFEVEVHNFQSIKKTVVQIQGFTAVVGRSNIGKSAVVRAVQHALTGAVGTDFVRHGSDCNRRVRGSKSCKCFSKVILRMGTMDVTWEKGEGVNRYTVQRPGSAVEVYEGLERGTPEFLLKGFSQVKIGDKKELVQVPDQFEPIFLLNRSGGIVADVLSDVARLDRINAAVVLVNKDRKAASSKLKVREEDLARHTQALSVYEGLDDIPTKSLEEALKVLKNKQFQLDQANAFLSRLEGLKEGYIGLTEVLKSEPPSIDSLIEKCSLLQDLSRFQFEADRLTLNCDFISEAHGQAIPSIDTLQKDTLNLTKLAQFYEGAASRVPIVNLLTQILQVEFPDDALMQSTYHRLEVTQGLCSKYAEAQVSEELLLEVRQSGNLDNAELDVLEVLWSRLQASSAFSSRSLTLEKSVQSTEADITDISNIEASLLTELREIGTCPTCEQPLGPDNHLHLGAA